MSKNAMKKTAVNDEQLVLYFYKDGLSRAEREAVAGALASDPDVAERYRQLSASLGDFTNDDVVAPPDMKARWHDSLDRAADAGARTESRPGIHSWSFLLGVAVTAALAIGVGIGVMIADETPATPPATTVAVTPEPDSSTAFLRGLQVHLRESEQDIAALPASSDAERGMLIMDIIKQNRRYERAAEQNDSENLARVLRAFELVLVELAAEDISPEDAEALRAKLLFELNVMLTKLSQPPSDEPTTI